MLYQNHIKIFYRELLCELITLSRETLEFNVSDSHWDMIVELRSQVQSKKEILTVRKDKIDLYRDIRLIKNILNMFL